MVDMKQLSSLPRSRGESFEVLARRSDPARSADGLGEEEEREKDEEGRGGGKQ